MAFPLIQKEPGVRANITRHAGTRRQNATVGYKVPWRCLLK